MEELMKRKERTEILVHCDKSFLKKWSDIFEKQERFEIIEKPSQSLVMVKMRESAQNTLFYLCEVLVSEARVECNGKIGIGIIQGIENKSAYYLAVIDAAYQCEFNEIALFEKELLEEKKKQLIEKHHKVAKVMKTKVNFETMDI